MWTVLRGTNSGYMDCLFGTITTRYRAPSRAYCLTRPSAWRSHALRSGWTVRPPSGEVAKVDPIAIAGVEEPAVATEDHAAHRRLAEDLELEQVVPANQLVAPAEMVSKVGIELFGYCDLASDNVGRGAHVRCSFESVPSASRIISIGSTSLPRRPTAAAVEWHASETEIDERVVCARRDIQKRQCQYSGTERWRAERERRPGTAQSGTPAKEMAAARG